MWQKFFEDYTYPRTGDTYCSYAGVRSEGGITILSLSMEREGFQTMVFRGDSDEFRFFARRISDTYTVYLSPNADRGVMSPEAHRQLVLSRAKEIEAGLKEFHIYKGFDSPVKQVVFDVGYGGAPVLKRLEEL